MMNPDLIQELPKLNYCEQGNKIFVKPGVYSFFFFKFC